MSRSLAARVGVWAVVLLLGASATAHAQIYSWREADGVLVVSDRPRAPDVTALAVRGAVAIRGTRAAPPSGGRDVANIIEQESARHGVRPALVRAVVQVESAFDPNARSAKGAMGLMQLMPGTAAELNVADPFDPGQNIRGGVTYLRRLLDRFDGSEELALAAYNAGPGTVSRHGNQVPPFAETRNYLAKVRSSAGPATAASSVGLAAAIRETTIRAPGHTIYKSYAVVDGQRIANYSDVPPRSPRPADSDGP
jgi:soluble lytic murein transglycosylase-like protein